MENNVRAILDGLNEEQEKAVRCVDGPVLIVAGAGSGKTRVLTSRVAYLLALGSDPSRILALTFTKKAAGEMKERIARMVGGWKARRVVMGTFHSIFVRFLREFAGSLGYPESFTIYDQSDSTAAVKTVVKELGLDDSLYKPRDVLARISNAKNNLITPRAYREDRNIQIADTHAKKPRMADIYDRYQARLKQSGVMDFDDILVNMNILLRDNKEALDSISARFTHIMVDEYQDTNYAQYLIIRKLAARHHNICVVGDDSQSIYAFRGAKIQNILNFKQDYQECKVFRLERNYRSTRTIVDAANSLIEHNTGRIPKHCYADGPEGEKIHVLKTWSEQDEAIDIVSAIQDRVRKDGAQYQDFAILYRTNAQSRPLEEQLRRRNIPYIVYSGHSFFDRAEVKDLMGYFKLVVNPMDDESFKRVVNTPARGIGDTSIRALEEAARALGTSLFRAAFSDGLEAYGLRSAGAQKIRSFCLMIDALNQKFKQTDAFELATEIADKSGILALYKADQSIEGQSRLANVEELINSVAAFVEEREDEAEGAEATFTLDDYLENVSLLSSVDIEDEEDTLNKVALMTVHSAKGLEFPYVFVAGLEDNLFPSQNMLLSINDIEEERRLFYVAVTRAGKVVTLSYAGTRMRNGRHESNAPSRFLREINPRYLDRPIDSGDFWGDSAKGFGSPRGSLTRTGGFGGFGRGLGDRGFSPNGVAAHGHVNGRDEDRRSETIRRESPVPTAATDPTFIPLPMTEFKVGMRIEHNRFGFGEILEITGKVPELKARVRFDTLGEKLLLLKYAKMRPEKK